MQHIAALSSAMFFLKANGEFTGRVSDPVKWKVVCRAWPGC